METKIRIKNRILGVVLGAALILVQSCATSSKHDIAGTPGHPTATSPKGLEQMGPPEPFGPPMPTPGVPAANPYGPDPVQSRSLVLVFGPGLARGFAYVGVLQALKEAKIPVAAVLGTEMGALIAALYATSPSVNQFDWALLKFKEDVFRDRKGFLKKFSDQPSEGAKLEEVLKQVFEGRDIASSKIPLRIALQARDTGIPILLDRGNIVQAIRGALAAPNLLTPGLWSSGGSSTSVVSAAATRPFLINEAKGMGLGPVLAVSVLSESETGVAMDELKSADLVLKPDVQGIDYLDFQKKTDAAFRGKTVILQHMAEIRSLLESPEKK